MRGILFKRRRGTLFSSCRRSEFDGRHPRRSGSRRRLELNPPLQLDDASGQAALGATEERVGDLRARAVEVEGLQVQEVEGVEEVRLDFEEAALAEESRKSEALGEAEVNVEVARAAEGVATDARHIESSRGRARVVTCGRVRGDRKNAGNEEPVTINTRAGNALNRPDIGEVASAYERIVRRVRARAAKVSDGPDRTDARPARVHAVAYYRRPREAGVRRQDAAQLPAAEQPADRVLAPAQEGHVPEAGGDEVVAHVVVRRASLQPHVESEGRVGVGRRAFVGDNVNALREAVDGVELEAATIAAREPRDQGVVVGCGVGRREEDVGEDAGVCEEEALVDEADELARGAALVAEFGGELVRQAVLAVERVGVDVGRRDAAGRAPDLDLPAGREVRRDAVRVEGHPQRGVRGEAEGRVVGTERVENLAAVEGRREVLRGRAAADAVAREEGRVAARVREFEHRDAVVEDAEAAAQDDLVGVEETAEAVAPVRAVGEADARAEVVAVGRVEALHNPERRAGQLLPRRAEDEVAEDAVLLSERSEVF